MKITDIPGIEVGHSTHDTEATGCTMILCREGAIAGVDVRGSAPGTRETELLRPTFMVRKIHGIMLSGGSAFGLRTADGAMQWCAENAIGYDARGIIVPIIPAAIIFDLTNERNTDFPSVQMGYDACANAGKNFAEGQTGVGRGAMVGKIMGREFAMNGGVASAATELPGGIRVGAIAVANALGDVIDPANGQIVAGVRNPDGSGFANTLHTVIRGGFPTEADGTNTTLAVVATNAKFTKEEINKIAQMAQNGIARSTRPAHTMHDGDVVFALSTGELAADVSIVGEVAAQMVAAAIVRAVQLGNKICE